MKYVEMQLWKNAQFLSTKKDQNVVAPSVEWIWNWKKRGKVKILVYTEQATSH